jgi:plastocyanin
MFDKRILAGLVLAGVLALLPVGVLADAPAVTVVEGLGAKQWSYAPKTLTVQVGDTVTWTNPGAEEHDVNADDGSFNSPVLSNGASFSFQFTQPGTYTYACSLHDNQTGTVVVAAGAAPAPVKPATKPGAPAATQADDAGGGGGY